MQLLKQALGIDVSKKTLALCFGTIDQQQRITMIAETTVENSAEGFAELLRWVEEHQHDDLPLSMVIEATGVYYEHLAYFLYEHQQQFAILLPNHSKQFAASTSTKTKTDRVDARLLCRMALERRIEPWQPASPLMRRLKDLMRERAGLIDQRTVTRNRLAALKASYDPSEQTEQRLEQQLALYAEHLRQIRQQISSLIDEDPQLRDRIATLEQIKGVSRTTILNVLAETNGFALVRCSNQLISYAGLDIVESQSGQHRGKSHISKRGNRRLRTALYMPALAAIRCDPVMRSFYQRLSQRYATSKKPAIITVARKLLRVIFALWKNPQPYDPQRLLAQGAEAGA